MQYQLMNLEYDDKNDSSRILFDKECSSKKAKVEGLTHIKGFTKRFNKDKTTATRIAVV